MPGTVDAVVRAAVRHLATEQGIGEVEFVDNNNPDEHLRDTYYRRTRRAGLLLSASELRGLVHIPTGAVRAAKLSRQIRHSRAAPAAVCGGEGLFLGVNEHHGASADVHLTDELRGRHVHIIGASGTGKSTLLLRMIGDDIRAGRGVGVLDPHGDLIDALLAVIPDHRVGDVVLLDPSDTTASVAFNILNTLTARSETEKTLLASDLVSVFQRLSTSWGDQMNIILRNAILAFLESPRGGTLSGMRRFLADKAHRQAYVAMIADADIRYYWEKTFDTFASKTSVGAVATRLEDLLAPKQRQPLRLPSASPRLAMCPISGLAA